MGSPADLTLGTPTVACAVDATEYLHALQEEKGKIEAFKRELPLCMHLIDQAIESARQRATDDPNDNCSDSKKRMSSSAPVLENFMPLKRRWERHNVIKAEEVDEEEEDDQKEVVVVGRPAWMGEAHLWTQQQQQQQQHQHSHQDSQAGARSSSRLLLSSKHRQGGAFVPFNRDRQQQSSPPFSPPNSTPEAAAAGHTNGDNYSDTVGSVDVNRSHDRSSSDIHTQRMSVDHTRTSGAAQPPRKARRCWSPELHRRFVNALQQLGGSQVATPKQIRELMKVDGLTNDEVKSHLQKYRLHTRRPSPSPASPPPMVILGWVPPECGVNQPAATHVLQDQYKSTASAQPQMHSPLDHSKKHLLSPASQTSSLRGPSPGGGESPHSSTDSYLDEDSDSEEQDQEIKCSTSTSLEQQQEISDGYKADQPALQSARESKGSTTRLADHVDDTVTTTTTKAVKLQTLRKTRAAA